MNDADMKHNETECMEQTDVNDVSCAYSGQLQFHEALKAALPIMAGYVVLGLPCGILCVKAGMDVWMVALMCALFYSGAGQYMIPNMWLAGNPLSAIIASVSLVNTRQMLYGASLSQFCGSVRKRLAFIFGATVTDESFGVNLARFINGSWTVQNSLVVNLLSQSTWLLANVAGALIGSAISLPTALASFAMTSLFICLLCMQRVSVENLIAVFGAIVGVVACKMIGLSGPAILVGALVGVGAALVFSILKERSSAHGEGTGTSGEGLSSSRSSDIRIGDR